MSRIRQIISKQPTAGNTVPHANNKRRHRLRYFAMLMLGTGMGLSHFVHASASSGCLNPVNFGAIPNDGQDDRVELQATIDAAIAASVDVCIPAGTFHVTRVPMLGTGGVSSLKIRGAVKMTGEGADATQLAMLGSGVVPGSQVAGNWRLIDVREGASNVYIGLMALDGSERFDTAEQTHLLHMEGPVSGVTAEHLRMTLPSLTPPDGSTPCPKRGSGAYCDPVTENVVGFYRGGDCVRLLGEAESPVQDVTLRHIDAPNCDRAAFSLQRGVRNVLIEDSSGACLSDQALDFEPSGGASIDGVTLRRVSLSRGGVDGTAYTASIGGNGAVSNVYLEDVNITGGALHMIDSTGVLLRRVNVNSGTVSANATLHIRRSVSDIVIEDSTFERPTGAPVAPVVSIHHQSGLAPSDVTFVGGALVQHVTSNFVNAESLGHLRLLRTRLLYSGGIAAANIAAVQNRAVIASIEEVELNGVAVGARAGSFEGLLRLSGTETHSKGRGVLTHNFAAGLRTYGLRYEAGAASLLPTIIERNVWDARVGCQGAGAICP